jgi:formylmethanofuran:tetrahydromethanopterin formyltransferase
MSTIVAEPTTAACPSWCANHFSVEGQPGVVIHNGERQTFGALMTTIGERAEQTVIHQTLTTLPDGTTCDDGMILNDVFLDVEGMEALVAGIRDGRTA